MTEAEQRAAESTWPSDIRLSIGGQVLTGDKVPAWLVEGDGRVLAANAAAGRAPLLAEDDRLVPSVAAIVAAALAEGMLKVAPVQFDVDGARLALEITVLPLDEGGRALVLAADRTLDVNLRHALIDSRARYKDLVEISSDFAWETGAGGELVFVSPRGALGRTVRELVGQPGATLLAPGRNASDLFPFLAPVPVDEIEVWMQDAAGQPVCMLASAVPLVSAGGEWLGARGLCRDITAHMERDHKLAGALNRERVFSRIMRSFRDEVDPDNMLRVAASTTTHGMAASGCQIFWNVAPSFRLAAGGTFDLAAGFGADGGERAVARVVPQVRDAADLFEQNEDGWQVLGAPTWYRDQRNGALVLWRSPGRPAWQEDDRILVRHLAAQVGIAIEQIANHQRLVRISRTDSLTGLLNRRAFYEELRRRFQRLNRSNQPGALIYCDLDNFKQVNDLYGHLVGDEVLLHVRDILYNNTRATDLVARLGGDEFAVWLDSADAAIASKRAEVFLAAATGLARHTGAGIEPVTMSLGIAVHEPGAPDDLNALVSRADHAMYGVKRSGKGRFALAAASGDAP